MRTDLTPAFQNEIDKPSRSPRLLVEFHFAGEILYLSDQVVGLAQNLPRDYDPIIADWGQLRDNVRLEPIVDGLSLEVRQCELSIINMGDPKFASRFKDENPENVRVYIYQWFDGMAYEDAALIDVFICQDPIVVIEASYIVKIRLVSPIMASNNYIWGPNRTIDVRYPMIIGKRQVIAKSMLSGPLGHLIYDVDQTFTGELYVDRAENADFPASGFIFIDSEQLAYDSFTVTKFNITARAQNGTTARPHIRGALVTNPSANYDFSLTAGPVSVIDNLVADGEVYNNPFTVFPGENPTFIRFAGRPPWHKVEAGAPGEPIQPPDESSTQYGVNSETYAEVVSAPSSPSNINNSGSNVVMAIDHSIGGQQSTIKDGTGSRVDDPSNGPTNNIDFWNGGGTFGNDKDANPSDQYEAGEEINTYSLYTRDNSALGDFVSVEVEIDGFTGQVHNYDCTFQLLVNGTVVKEAQRTQQGIFNDQWEYFTFGQFFVEGINSWSALANLKIEINVLVNERFQDRGDQSQFYCHLDDIAVTVTYQPTVSATYPIQEVVSHFNRDLSNLGSFTSAEVKVRFDCASINCTLTQSIVSRQDNDPDNNQSLWSRQITSTQGEASVTVYPSIGSMATLKNTRVGLRHRVDAPAGAGDRRIATTNVRYVEWKITYTPGAIDQPDEERVIYVTELMADVTSQLGENVTPAKAVETLISSVGGLGEYIDAESFDRLDLAYIDQLFYFNGLIDGETRFHDALKNMLRQGQCRILYNAGLIKLTSQFIESLEPVVPTGIQIAEAREMSTAQQAEAEGPFYLYKTDIRRQGVTEQRMRLNDVINKVTLRYDPNPQYTEWAGEYVVSDDASIGSIGEQETSLDYPLISSDDVAVIIGDRILEMKGEPRVFTTFRVYMKAFGLEKSDQVFVETDFNDYFGIVGPIMTMNRVFGSGRNKKMNIYDITVLSTPIVAHSLELSDTIQVNDSLDLAAVLSIDKLIEETINVNESFSTEVQYTQFLEIFEQIAVNESGNYEKGIEKFLNITDVVNLSDSISFQSVLPLYLSIADRVDIFEQVSNKQHLQLELLIEDIIEVNDPIQSLDAFGGQYGVGGYGEGGYGGGDAHFLVYFKTDYVTFAGDDVINLK